MNTVIKAILTFISGATIGLLTGILTAPRSGKATRVKVITDIKDQKDQLEEAATRKLEEAKTILNESIEKQKKASMNNIDKVAEAIKVS